MHKSQYEAIAKAINENTETAYLINKWNFVEKLCDILAADNPKFDKAKFLEGIK